MITNRPDCDNKYMPVAINNAELDSGPVKIIPNQMRNDRVI